VKLRESSYYCHHLLVILWESSKASRGPTSDSAWSKRALHILTSFFKTRYHKCETW